MSNVFDGLKLSVFNTVASTMGYDAVWFADGIENPGISARVLYNYPSKEEEVANHSYMFDRPTIEFKIGDFPGLKGRVDANSKEVIQVRGELFYVFSVHGKDSIANDGENFFAELSRIENEL